MAALLLGFTSCEQDRDPVYQVPTTFELNTPALQDQYVTLAEGSTLELVCSQPDYGYSAVANYSAEMSLTEDFANPVSLSAVDKTQARMSFKQEDIAIAMMDLQGIDSEEKYAEVYPEGATFDKVYFRAICQLDGVESSRIVSNVVSYNYIQPYFAIKLPGFIYLVGAPEGWAGPTAGNATHYADWRLFEPKDAIGSKVYSGVFDIPAGSAMFRFYTTLTGWEADSYGSQEADNPVEFPDFTEGSFTTPVVKGKGAFNFSNWPGGKMTITVDMSDEKNMTLTCTAGESSVVVTKYIYLVGAPEGWVGPTPDKADHYKDWRLADSTGDNIYIGEFEIPAGQAMFRFYTELASWDENSLGAQEPDLAVDCSLPYSGAYVSGKGAWNFPGWDGGTMVISVDMNTKSVSMSKK